MTVFRHDVHIEQLAGPRFDLALQLLGEGVRVVFQGACLELSNDALRILFPSSWQLQNVTNATALRDFAQVSASLNALRDSSALFARMCEGRQIIMTLIDDYETGYIALCEYNGKTIEWEHGFPRNQRP